MVLEIVLWRCCKWLFESLVCLQRCLFINPSKSFFYPYQCHIDLGWKHWICRCWWIRVVQRLCWLGGMIISVRVRIAKATMSDPLKLNVVIHLSKKQFVDVGNIHRSQVISELTGFRLSYDTRLGYKQRTHVDLGPCFPIDWARYDAYANATTHPWMMEHALKLGLRDWSEAEPCSWGSDRIFRWCLGTRLWVYHLRFGKFKQ